MKKPSEESQACYFYGLARNAGICYQSVQGGELSGPESTSKFIKTVGMFHTRLAEQYFRDLERADLDEISFEIDWSKGLEKQTHNFWKLCGDLGSKNFISTADRDYPVRPFTEEMNISYCIGITWLMRGDIPHRDDIAIDYLRKSAVFVAPNMTRERLYELYNFYMDDKKVVEWRLIAFDILDIRMFVRAPKQ